MSHSSMDSFAPSDSTRVSSNSPTWSSLSFGSTSTVPNTTAPLPLFSRDHYSYGSWTNGKGNHSDSAHTDGFDRSRTAATRHAVEAAVRQPPTPPTVQLHDSSLSSPPPCAPCGPVTFVPPLALLVPRPVPSSQPSIGCAWPAKFQPPSVLANTFPSGSPPQPLPSVPPRPHMQVKIPPEKVRKPFPCLQPGCGMKFPKRNALFQHMRTHTGERPEVCQYCKRAFSLKCNLRRHYKTCKEKKAMDQLGAGITQDPPSSPGSFGHSPSPSASSPLSITSITSCLDSPPGDVFVAPPFLWDPSFGIDPSQQRPVIDTTCENLFPTQFTYLTPCPPLIQLNSDTCPYFPTQFNPPHPPRHYSSI